MTPEQFEIFINVLSEICDELEIINTNGIVVYMGDTKEQN